MMAILAKFTVPQEALDVLQRMSGLQGGLDAMSSRVTEKIARTAVKRVRRAILQKMLDLAPASPAWLAYKARHGLDSRTLVASKQYVQSMKAVRIDEKSWGVEADYDLYKFHEYGTKNMPARPHWTPVLIDMRGYIQTIFAREVDKVLSGNRAAESGEE